MVTTLRWILVPVVASSACAAVLFLGILFYSRVEIWWCGKEALSNYTCHAPRWLLGGVVVLFVALSAVASLSAGFFTAPVRRSYVSWGLFFAGSAVALVLSGFGSEWPSLVAACASGAATAQYLSAKHTRPSSQ